MYRRSYGRSLLLRLILLALSALALGQSIAMMRAFPLKQTEAEILPETEKIAVYGTVSRCETPIYAPEAAQWQILCPDGSRVSAGQPLFSLGGTGAEVQAQVESFRQEYEAQPLSARRAEIHAAIRAMNAEKDTAEKLTALLSLENGTDRTADYTSAEPTGRRVITAEESGVFALGAGNYPEEIVMGRLILSDEWEFCTILPFAVSEGDRLEGMLLGGILKTCTFTVCMAEPIPDGTRVSLRCETHIADVVNVRSLAVEFEPK